MKIKLKASEAGALALKSLADKEFEIEMFRQSDDVKVDGKVQKRANPGITAKGGQRGTIVTTPAGPVRVCLWIKDASSEGQASGGGEAL